MSDKYFEQAREMFLTEGWKTFQEEVNEAIESCKVDTINSADEFWLVKGRLQVLRQMAGYEAVMLAAEAQAEEDDA